MQQRTLFLLDCQAKCNRQIEKGLIWGTKAETLSGTVVQLFYNPQNIVVPNLSEVDSLGQILANESVRVFIRTTLPGAVGMGEVHRDPQGSGYFLVSRKLLSVVCRQTAALHPLGQTDQVGLNSSRRLVLYLLEEGLECPSLAVIVWIRRSPFVYCISVIPHL